MSEQEKVCTQEEILEMFKITPQTLAKWRKSGEIKYEKIGNKYFYYIPNLIFEKLNEDEGKQIL